MTLRVRRRPPVGWPKDLPRSSGSGELAVAQPEPAERVRHRGAVARGGRVVRPLLRRPARPEALRRSETRSGLRQVCVAGERHPGVRVSRQAIAERQGGRPQHHAAVRWPVPEGGHGKREARDAPWESRRRILDFQKLYDHGTLTPWQQRRSGPVTWSLRDCPLVDILGRPVNLASLPRRGGLQVIDTITMTTGGNVPNYGIDLAKLGLRVGVITRVGNDEFGRFVTRRFAGTWYRHLGRDRGPPPADLRPRSWRWLRTGSGRSCTRGAAW